MKNEKNQIEQTFINFKDEFIEAIVERDENIIKLKNEIKSNKDSIEIEDENKPKYLLYITKIKNLEVFILKLIF